MDFNSPSTPTKLDQPNIGQHKPHRNTHAIESEALNPHHAMSSSNRINMLSQQVARNGAIPPAGSSTMAGSSGNLQYVLVLLFPHMFGNLCVLTSSNHNSLLMSGADADICIECLEGPPEARNIFCHKAILNRSGWFRARIHEAINENVDFHDQSQVQSSNIPSLQAISSSHYDMRSIPALATPLEAVFQFFTSRESQCLSFRHLSVFSILEVSPTTLLFLCPSPACATAHKDWDLRSR